MRSLAGSKVAVQPGGGSVTAKKIAGKISIDPFDKTWKNIRAKNVPLMLLWQRQESVDSVSVKAIHNSKEIAFLLEWEDLTPEARFIRHQDFTDGVAVQFPVDPKRKPLFTMGALDTEKEENTVNIWFWRADRQLDIDKKKFNDIDDTYAGMVADDYQLSKALYPKDKERENTSIKVVTAVADQDPTYIAGWGAGNFASLPDVKSPVENLNSEGFSTLTPRSVDEQNVNGRGVWDNGKWKVVIVRSLDSKYKYDAKFKPGQKVPVAFAVWNGAQGDRNGQKAVTPWYDLKIE